MMVEIIGMRFPGSSIPNPLGGESSYTRQIMKLLMTMFGSQQTMEEFIIPFDRGNNWTVYQSPISDFGSAEVNGNLSFADSQNGVIIDNSGNVYRSTNAGASWTQISTTGPVYTSGLCFIEGTNTIFSTGEQVRHLVMMVDTAGILLILQLTYMLIFMMKISAGLEDGQKPVLSLLEEFGSGKISV